MLLTALSIKQPFASAILTGQKTEEFRCWPTRYRGLVAVHAPKALMPEGFDDFPNFQANRVPRGVLLGVVDVVGCEEAGNGVWAWLLKDPAWLTRPLPCKGRLGLFPVEVPAELLAEVVAGIKHPDRLP
jgi:hypothetical protein